MTVTIDRELEESYEWVRVDGLLRFAPDTNTSLTLETLVVEHHGTLEIGTVREPVTARAVLTFQHRGGPIDHIYDPFELSRGLVATGRVEMHGEPRTSWVSVSEIPQVDTLWLTLDRAPIGWAPGDTVVLTSSRYGEDETFQILSVDGASVRIDRPIKNARQFPVDPRTGSAYEGLSLHVGNLSRNVVVRTHPDYAGQPKLQGHVMLMHRGGHSIKYAAFENLGRTSIDPVTDPLVGAGGVRDPSLCPPAIQSENIRGRYAVHFHMASPTSEQSIVEGSVLVVGRGSRLKIGYINHSSNVVFKDNVGVNIDGSTYFTEEGDELGAFINNLAIYSVGSKLEHDEQPRDVSLKNHCPEVFERRRLDVGHRGHGFWIHGGGVAVTGNVAAEHDASGFIIWTRALDYRLKNTFRVQFPVALLPGGGQWVLPARPMLPIAMVPFAFQNNTSYVQAHGDNGGKAAFEVNYHSIRQAQEFPNAPKNVFSGSLGWNSRNGLLTTYSGWIRFDRIRLIKGDLSGPLANRGLSMGMNLATQGGNHNAVSNVAVDGFTTGVRPSTETTFENVLVDGAPYFPQGGETPQPAPGPTPSPPPRR